MGGPESEFDKPVDDIEDWRSEPLGNPDCQVCNGSGWEIFQKRMEAVGVEPYWADFARPCKCRT